MATQLADRGSNPDLWSGKFGPRPTIGPKFGPSHFFGHETHCHVKRSIPQIALKTFFYFCFWSSIGFWFLKAVKTFF